MLAGYSGQAAKTKSNLLQRRTYEEHATASTGQLGIDETQSDDPIMMRQKRANELARAI